MEKKKKNDYKPYRPAAAKIANAIIRGLDHIGGRTLALNEEKLIRKARKKTGHYDFGDDSFIEPLNILCDLTREGKVLTAAGRMLFKMVIPNCLENKLKIQSEIAAHPEILEEEIKEPIILAGLPRTGSSFLHRLLAEDPANRAPLHWEATAPVPPPEPATHKTDKRIKQGNKIWSFLYYIVGPHMKAIHESSGTSPEECMFLMNNDLISWWFAVLTSDKYLDYLLEKDFTFPYYLHKRQLQILQWKFPKKRWVLKNFSNLYELEALLKVYPDARIIHLHRNILEVLPSIASLYTNIRGALFESVDPVDVGTEWFNLGFKFIERGLAIREKLQQLKNAKSLFYDVRYPDLVSDPIGTIKNMYDAFGIELSQEALIKMKKFVKENPQGKHGKHFYTLEKYGLDEKEIKEKYGHYFERFGL